MLPFGILGLHDLLALHLNVFAFLQQSKSEVLENQLDQK